MAKEIIIKCDRCGDIIENRPYKIMVCRESRYGSDYVLASTEYDSIHLCGSCSEELLDHIGEFIHQEDARCKS